MVRARKGTSSVIAAAMFLSLCATISCSGYQPSTETTVGAVGGAAAGGLLGAAIGDSPEATAAGVILGGLVGAGVGEYLNQRDRRYMSDTTYDALENTRTGNSVAWKNPDTGHSGEVTPTETFQTAQGVNCREFKQTVMIDGEANTAHGTACRQQDGNWKIVQ